MDQWVERNRRYTLVDPESGFSIDFAGMAFTDAEFDAMRERSAAALREMGKIEAGEIKNADEHRKVTHFTDRISYPDSELFAEVERFAADIRSGKIAGGGGEPFDAVVVNGIGGSALGPQLMQFAANGPYWNEKSREQRQNNLKIYFLDNTDSAEFRDLVEVMDPARTLHLVVSKSGGTQETKNNLIAMENFYAERGLDFARHAAAVTMPGSELDKYAHGKGFLAVFAMAESIGGRTSETSIVGHVPAALTGVDFKSFLAGACAMDRWTREPELARNPAAALAAMWFIAGRGRGDRNMVIVPYSDRLILTSRYLQQLVMESLGKELDRRGNVVHQGLNVFGNKGGTDAHAFIQQLNDGRDDFFATFIEVLEDAASLPIADGVGMGDYLHGFLAGLTSALLRKKRQVITVKLPKLNVFALGQLIALYERAVAIYAEYIDINAFHQPGVQAYKLAAKGVLALREKLFAALKAAPAVRRSADEIAASAGLDASDAVTVGDLLDKAALNGAATREFDAGRNCWLYTTK
ncbi:MAG: glucose-6-phosphate isomerase [Lentisphaeria bacterium]|nr:glucose-6-phosphate isomerase [Lentisphaeria bacterium]